MTHFRTFILLAALTALFLAVGYLLGGQMGLVIALLMAAMTNLFAYWQGDKMVLALHGARKINRGDAPDFHDRVMRLAASAGLPPPQLYLIENDQPNAFATGRNPHHAAVAATTGLLKLLTADEIDGVMAHELAHVKNRDTLLMTITATLAGAISMLANFGLFFGGRDRNNQLGVLGSLLLMILAPLGAMLVQMAISRQREYGADALGAEISGNPRALASALAKISHLSHKIPNPEAEANPATAHLFIINPLTGQGMDPLFSTHPATENRIAALEQMAKTTRTSPESAMERPYPTGPWG